MPSREEVARKIKSHFKSLRKIKGKDGSVIFADGDGERFALNLNTVPEKESRPATLLFYSPAKKRDGKMTPSIEIACPCFLSRTGDESIRLGLFDIVDKKVEDVEYFDLLTEKSSWIFKILMYREFLQEMEDNELVGNVRKMKI